jgi:1-deoxy-D-xylulose-5-phosphate reductoisomerase
VGRFLEGQLGFLDIPRAVERVLEQLPVQASPTLDDLVAADTEARRRVEELPLPTSN